jgi:anti-anti-sigma factor
MQLTPSKVGDVLVIQATIDNLDASNATDFKETVLKLIKESSLHQVVIDLHAVQFIDSSGLGSFLGILRSLQSEGGELKLASLNKSIRTLFELVSMHKIFEIFNSTDDATRSFTT